MVRQWRQLLRHSRHVANNASGCGVSCRLLQAGAAGEGGAHQAAGVPALCLQGAPPHRRREEGGDLWQAARHQGALRVLQQQAWWQVGSGGKGGRQPSRHPPAKCACGRSKVLGAPPDSPA